MYSNCLIMSPLSCREILLQTSLLLPPVWLCSEKEACSLPCPNFSQGTYFYLLHEIPLPVTQGTIYHFVLVVWPSFVLKWERLWTLFCFSSAGDPGAPNTYGHRGCPWKGDGGVIPLSWAPAFRYPTFLSCCGGCALPSGLGLGSPPEYPPPHAFMDLLPCGTQPPRLTLLVYLLHLSLLLFDHQCPAQPSLAWLSCPFFSPSLLPFFLLPTNVSWTVQTLLDCIDSLSVYVKLVILCLSEFIYYIRCSILSALLAAIYHLWMAKTVAQYSNIIILEVNDAS